MEMLARCSFFFLRPGFLCIMYKHCVQRFTAGCSSLIMSVRGVDILRIRTAYQNKTFTVHLFSVGNIWSLYFAKSGKNMSKNDICSYSYGFPDPAQEVGRHKCNTKRYLASSVSYLINLLNSTECSPYQ